jgi:hypothetical protein
MSKLVHLSAGLILRYYKDCVKGYSVTALTLKVAAIDYDNGPPASYFFTFAPNRAKYDFKTLASYTSKLKCSTVKKE